jgi:ABC-type sugar transport system ATPase subunit/ribose/xylose/arabinose/galactoside ABC-type transport system permease subunit
LNTLLVEVQHIRKAFGGVQALRGVSLEIAAGEVHALCGENGAGKSTLVKVLSGVVTPDAGTVLISGQPLPRGGVRASEAAGIAVIHQESVDFPHLTAPENLFVGREPRRARVLLNRTAMCAATRALLNRLGETLPLDVPVGDLTVAQCRMVAIARALSRRCRLLIMDEPTAALSAREAEVLFRIIGQLQSQGISVLYVSHRLEEVLALATRVTVLRDGQLVGTHPIAAVDRDALVRMMVGGEVQLAAPARTPQPRDDGAPLLCVRGLSRRGAFEDITFDIRAGELVGLGGLVGAGRSEVARAVFGIDCPDAGTVSVAGRTLAPGSVPAALAAGLALVPEDRQHEGLVLPLSVARNLTLALLRRLSRWGFTSQAREAPVVDRAARELDLRLATADAAVDTLSGGNQQKVVLGKWLATTPRVLILDEPTRGVDVGAKAEVHGHIRRLAAAGLGGLLISSDLPELLALSDRVLVMREGCIVRELARADATQENVLSTALGDEAQRSARAVAPPESRLTRLLRRREFVVAALLLLTLAAVSLINANFATAGNLRDMLVQCVPTAIVACGLLLVIGTGEIDISVGSLMGLLAAVLGLLTSPGHAGLPAAVGVTLAVLAGAAVGLVNGLLVTVARIPSIIATLGMLTALRGATELLMGGNWITDLPPGVRFLGVGTLFGLPVSVIVALLVIAGTALLVRQTPVGLRIYAVGSNPAAAPLAGLSPRAVKLLAFTLTGLLTGLATVVGVPQLSVIESGIGVGFELLVVTCVVVGGASIRGGQGSLMGAMLAVLLLGSLRTMLVFLKLGVMATYWERAVQGAFILAAVLLDHLTARRRTGGIAP